VARGRHPGRAGERRAERHGQRRLRHFYRSVATDIRQRSGPITVGCTHLEPLPDWVHVRGDNHKRPHAYAHLQLYRRRARRNVRHHSRESERVHNGHERDGDDECLETSFVAEITGTDGHCDLKTTFTQTSDWNSTPNNQTGTGAGGGSSGGGFVPTGGSVTCAVSCGQGAGEAPVHACATGEATCPDGATCCPGSAPYLVGGQCYETVEDACSETGSCPLFCIVLGS
jgi:hypothetical protein